MSSLIANGGATATAAGTPEPPITNNGFWPDIDVVELRASTRLSGNVTPARLRASAVDAMMSVNRELSTYRAAMIGQGWDSAADIGESIDGKTELVQHYLRAVASTVQADMAEKYRDWDSTRAGDYRADFEGVAADDFRRNARWAIAAILGTGRSIVELI